MNHHANWLKILSKEMSIRENQHNKHCQKIKLPISNSNIFQKTRENEKNKIVPQKEYHYSHLILISFQIFILI